MSEEYERFLQDEKAHKSALDHADSLIEFYKAENNKLLERLKGFDEIKIKARIASLEAARQIFPHGKYENFSQRGYAGQMPENLIVDAEMFYQWLIK